jgi:hypothetical protein
MVGLMLLSAVSAASAKTLPIAIAVHVPQSVTLRSMEGVQSEIIDIRATLQRDDDKLRLRPAGTVEDGFQKHFIR